MICSPSFDDFFNNFIEGGLEFILDFVQRSKNKFSSAFVLKEGLSNFANIEEIRKRYGRSAILFSGIEPLSKSGNDKLEVVGVILCKIKELEDLGFWDRFEYEDGFKYSLNYQKYLEIKQRGNEVKGE